MGTGAVTPLRLLSYPKSADQSTSLLKRSCTFSSSTTATRLEDVALSMSEMKHDEEDLQGDYEKAGWQDVLLVIVRVATSVCEFSQ